MNKTLYIICAIAIMSALIYLLRALPFILFAKTASVPKSVIYLGQAISAAAIAMLVVYCFGFTDVTACPYGLPEFIAALAVVALHLIRHNSLLSIFGGTALYMLLLRIF